MLLPTLDVETRSRVNLKTAGTYKYAEHPSTEFISIAYCLDPESKEVHLWVPGDPDPDDLLAHVELGGLIEAQNSYFEYCTWHFIAHKKLGWPDLDLNQWRCSKAKSQSNGLPGSLEGVAKALRSEIQKDKTGADLIKVLCSPVEEKSATQRKAINNFISLGLLNPDPKTPGEFCDDPRLLQKMYAYNKTDVLTEMSIASMMPEMPKEEVDIWILDQKINNRGIYIDRSAVEGAIKILDDTDHLTDRIVELSGGAFKTSGQRDKILKWCSDRGAPLEGYTATHISEALKTDLPHDVSEVLRIRQILGKSSTKKYQKMLDRVASDGRIHEVGVYHRAHTGRWGGAGVQVQNLPRPTVYPPKDNPNLFVELLRTGSREVVEAHHPNAFEVAASAIRSMIMAAPGHDFISADYSAIEARVIFWLAHDEEALEIFREDGCIYCKTAAAIYNEDYKTLYKAYLAEDPEAEVKRTMGKVACLGLNYQMGAKRFVAHCESYGISLTLEASEGIVGTYRSLYKKLVKLWRKLEECAVNAVENKGRVFKTSKSRRAIQFKFAGMFLLARLPSGRCLHYAYPRIDKVKTSWGATKNALTYMNVKEGKWCRSTTFGGKLAENVTQAVARDVLRDAMLKVEARNYPIVMTVHDEILAEVPKGFGSVGELETVMCDSNPWAKGLPLAAKGWRGERYRK